MRTQHLSDEAVAAFADGALRGHANDRASGHCAECAECAYAVAVQREAVWALRAAPAPSLPTGLLDRLRDVPSSTPLQGPPPAAFGPDGSPMFAAFGTPAAALAPQQPEPRGGDEAHSRAHLSRPIATVVAATAAAGLLAVGSAAYAAHDPGTGHRAPAAVRPADGNQAHIGVDYGNQFQFAPAIWSAQRRP